MPLPDADRGDRAPYELLTLTDLGCFLVFTIGLPAAIVYIFWSTGFSARGISECFIAVFMVSGVHVAATGMAMYLRSCTRLPPLVAVWFEEASLIVDKSGAHRYNRPFVSLGEAFMVSVIAVLVCVHRYQQYSYDVDWHMLYPIFCATWLAFGNNIRCWRRTWKQYERKLQIVLGQAPAHIVMIDSVTTALLDALEPLVSSMGTNCVLSPELRTAKAEMAIEGAQRALTFVIDTLKQFAGGDGSADTSPTFKDSLGNHLPLHRHWVILNAGIKAGAAFLEQKMQDGSYLVTGAKRKALMTLLRQSEAQASSLKQRARAYLGGQADAELDVIIGLVKVQRSITRTRRATKRKTKKAHAEEKVCSELTSENEPCEEPVEAEAEADTEGVCVSCFDDVANYVFVDCGHLCYCNTCRGLVKKLVCPLCRTESRMIEKSMFQGHMYVP